ncbi:MAG: cyclic nucleotide-binding domain-containing protein, partial [Candidatus Latescibacteria bacterium]|nr:cyclic nucleotide-binding domain-containing protein [Candidatus Latescibacterota bacterium]
VGGGPSGSFFAYFLLEMAERVGRRIAVDLYEPRDFSQPSPKGCNMCGGIISESLVQNLAAEGINLPSTVVQRGIDSYILHMDVGSVRIDTPLHEMRIAAVYRGSGPRDQKQPRWGSFDGHLQDLAAKKGVRILPKRVERIARVNGLRSIRTEDAFEEAYDLVAVTSGLNAFAPKFLKTIAPPYDVPATTKTLIREYHLGEETIRDVLGTSMHVFLLNIPRLEFAAIIPKGDYATVCLLGVDIDKELVDSFMNAPPVRARFPTEWDAKAASCQCWPKINIRGSRRPFDDRLVFIGDCAVTRLYKDGIGGAYRAAKAAATTAVFHGVSSADFRQHYLPYCRRVATDNALGKLTFLATRVIQRSRPIRRAVWRLTSREQAMAGRSRRMSQVLWDLFTGSASYQEILVRTLHPAFLYRFARHFFPAVQLSGTPAQGKGATMRSSVLGRVYQEGEYIVRQGHAGECMYVIQSGEVEVTIERDGVEVPLRTLRDGDFFGEMALFDREVRSASVRAKGEATVLTVDRSGLMKRIQEDPSLAFRMIQQMSGRIRQLTNDIVRLKGSA